MYLFVSCIKWIPIITELTVCKETFINTSMFFEMQRLHYCKVGYEGNANTIH